MDVSDWEAKPDTGTAAQWKNPMTVNARVHKHRDTLRSQDCGRLDVWVGNDWIKGARMLAEYQKRPLWQLVQDALKAYISQNARIIRTPKDRDR